MKTLPYILLSAVLILLFAGCASDNSTEITAAATTAATYPLPTGTVATTEPAVHTFRIDIDPYSTCPSIWTANCEEFIALRSAPDSSDWLTKIPAGASMELLNWEGRFAHVRYNGEDGYVLASYLAPADSDAVSSQLQIVQPTAVYSYEQMNRDIARLTETYPAQCTADSIGNSEEGRAIPVIRIGDPDAENHILIQGAIHAREHMTAWLIMAMADYWLANGIADMPDTCFHLIPMTNPDGVTISQTGTLGDSQLPIYHHDRQTKKTEDTKTAYATRWKANALGTDLNRNFPAGWESLQDVTAPSFNRYRGSKPLSASESAALADYTLRYPFDITVGYHAFGSLIYYAYGTKQPVNEQSYQLANEMQAVTGYPPEGSSLTEGGGYKDWAMDALGIPSLTIEVGCQSAPLKERELPSIFFRNLWVLPALAQWLTH